MDFKPNKLNLLFFNIISPIFLLAAIILYLSAPLSAVIHLILIILSWNFLFNMLTLFTTYNEIKLTTNSIILIKGIIKKKRFTMQYKKIRSLWKTGLPLAGLKAFDAIIPVQGYSYNPKLDKFKMHKGSIDDLEFEKLENELEWRIGLDE